MFFEKNEVRKKASMKSAFRKGNQVQTSVLNVRNRLNKLKTIDFSQKLFRLFSFWWAKKYENSGKSKKRTKEPHHEIVEEKI